MADSNLRISEMDPASLPLSGSEAIPAVQGGSNVRTTPAAITAGVQQQLNTVIAGTPAATRSEIVDTLRAGINVTLTPAGSGATRTLTIAATAGGAGVSAVTGNAPITSTGGSAPAIGITAASGAGAGSMSQADFTKLAGVATGATANSTDAQLRDRGTHTGTQTAATISDFPASSRAQTEATLLAGTNVSLTPAGSGTTRTITIAATAGGAGVSAVTGTAPIVSSGGGTPAISITPASGSAAGSMSSADFTKLAGVAAGATANLGTVTNTTGTAPIQVATGTTTPVISITAATTAAAGSMSGADKTKLDGVATGATANSTDAQLRDRGTHTGTQLAATISDFPASSRAQTEATLLAGTNVSLTPAGSGATRTITIAAAGGSGVTNLSIANHTATALDIASSTGTDATVPLASATLAGLLSPAEKAKIAESEALLGQFNAASRAQTEAMLTAGTNVTLTPSGSGATRLLQISATAGGAGVSAVTGNAPITSTGGGSPAIGITAASGSAAGSMSSANFTKLAGIATGATANATDAQLRDRATHTGTQAASTISDFNASSRAQTEATLVAGTNITFTPAGTGATRTITVAAAGGSALVPATPTVLGGVKVGDTLTVAADGLLNGRRIPTVALTVSPTGTANPSSPLDVANGGLGEPFALLSQAVAYAVANSAIFTATISVAAGTYTEPASFTINGQAIGVISGDTAATTIITSSVAGAQFISVIGNARITNMTIRSTATQPLFLSESASIRLTNCTLEGAMLTLGTAVVRLTGIVQFNLSGSIAHGGTLQFTNNARLVINSSVGPAGNAINFFGYGSFGMIGPTQTGAFELTGTNRNVGIFNPGGIDTRPEFWAGSPNFIYLVPPALRDANLAAGAGIALTPAGTGATRTITVAATGDFPHDTIPYAATVNLDATALAGSIRTITLTGDLTFTASNLAVGKTFGIRLIAGASERTLAWPAGWVVGLGSAGLPTTLAADKTARFTVECYGSTAADVVVGYAVQP